MANNTASVIGVTGAGGYVGSVLASRLRGAAGGLIELRRTVPPGRADVRPFDLRDTAAPAVCAGLDALVHCAYDFRAHGWDEIRAINVEGTRRLFRAAIAQGVRRLILISSASAYPGCRSLYGRAKLETEAIAADCGAVIIRPGLVYGDRPGGMVGSLSKLLALPFVPLVGSGKSILYAAHEEDLARLVEVAVAGAGGVGSVPIVAAHSRGYSLREIMSSLAAAQGLRPRFVSVPTWMVGGSLRMAEALGLRLRIRYDGLVGLLYPDPAPDFGPLERTGVDFRPFPSSR
jgi:nucleoside-diphosphate-sugar epimerase